MGNEHEWPKMRAEEALGHSAEAVVLGCSSESIHFEEVCVPKVALPLRDGLALVQVEDGSSLTKNGWMV